MTERDEVRKSTLAVRPPPPSHPEQISVPPLEPLPSSLGPIAGRKKRAPARESRRFWLLLVLLFVFGTFVTFYLQR